MIVLSLKLHNILCFDDFFINFSYPKKLNHSLVNNECLLKYPSFRYKKVNIFIGSNASGKSCLMKTIHGFMMFLSRKSDSYLKDLLNKSESSIEMDFIDNDKHGDSFLYRVKMKSLENDKKDTYILLAVAKLSIGKGASYESKKIELDKKDYKFSPYLDCLNDYEFNYDLNAVMPATEEEYNKISFIKCDNKEKQKEYLNILNAVFKTLDNSISLVSQSSDSSDAYVINQDRYNRKIIVQENMKLTSIPYLSSGTKYGFNIANMIYAIKNKINGTYLIDEQLSYVDSDIECAILSTIVSLISDDQQIFFTTHNSNVLNLGFPFHAFNFMRKLINNNEIKFESFCASLVENRNNVSAKTILDNDVFATATDISKILELGNDIN